MLPQSLLHCSFHFHPDGQARILPHFLTEADRAWIRLFYEEFLSCEGKRRREILEHFEGRLSFECPQKKRDLLFHHLLKLSDDPGARLPSSRAKKLRAALFEEAAQTPVKQEPSRTLDTVANRLERKAEGILDDAFSDLALERRLTKIPHDLTSSHLQLSVNLLLAQALVCRSASVTIRAQGNIRRLVRQAKLRRLLCQVSRASPGQPPILEISGPLSLFGHTTVYGRHLSELLPLLSGCHRFRLEARCRLRGREGLLELRSGDPIPTTAEPPLYDSKLEARFARDFSKLTSDWELIREADPIEIAGSPSTLIFPDFLIRHRRDLRRKWYLEIAGFWTTEYLERKLNQLKSVPAQNLILAVDRSLVCDAQVAHASQHPVIYFQKRVDPAEILKRLY